jgi:2-octaprenyl-6-methoxyphenol hydroxylase
VAELPAVRQLAPAAFAGIDRAANRIEVRLADGRTLQPRLLVAADGRESPVRTAVGIPVLRRDWGQTAIVCSFAHELPHEDTSTEIHRPGGPFTMVPLPGRRSSLVWVERTADVELLLAMATADFQATLQTRTAGWLGAVRLADAPRGYPLAGRLAVRLHAPRVALIAEAAHGLHPIGAQGLNLSLRDAACLAELVVDAFRDGQDVGAVNLLRRYDLRRRGDAFARFAATGGLNRVASTDNGALRLLRDIGLRGLAAARPLRALLMSRGMAALGPEPRLALGHAL